MVIPVLTQHYAMLRRNLLCAPVSPVALECLAAHPRPSPSIKANVRSAHDERPPCNSALSPPYTAWVPD